MFVLYLARGLPVVIDVERIMDHVKMTYVIKPRCKSEWCDSFHRLESVFYYRRVCHGRVLNRPLYWVHHNFV